MARKDVYNYLTQMQKQMNDANKILTKINKEIEEGKVSEEQKENFMNYYMSIKSNYDRVMYIVHLLNLPPKFIQKLREFKLKHRGLKDSKKLTGSLEEVKQENDNSLSELNSIEQETQNG